MRGIMRRIGYKSPMLIVNDALVALTAGAGDGPGIVVICGTGSICYGRNDAAEAARSGGWGYILGDEGSGYWIGRGALAAVVRHADGRGPATSLGPADPAALPRARCAGSRAGGAPPRPATPPRGVGRAEPPGRL